MLRFEQIDIDSACGSSDYEYLQEYIEEYSKRMNEKKFVEKYREKGMGERLHLERTADVFEIEERNGWTGEESNNRDK